MKTIKKLIKGSITFIALMVIILSRSIIIQACNTVNDATEGDEQVKSDFFGTLNTSTIDINSVNFNSNKSNIKSKSSRNFVENSTVYLSSEAGFTNNEGNFRRSII